MNDKRKIILSVIGFVISTALFVISAILQKKSGSQL